MSDLASLRSQGVPICCVVDATGVALNGTTSFVGILARGMQPICQVDSTGVETTSGLTVRQLAARGIRSFCQVDETGANPSSGDTMLALHQRGIVPLAAVDTSGIAQNGSASISVLRQRGIAFFCPVDENGSEITVGIGIALSTRSIAENVANGTTLGTATVVGTTGTPTWSLTDASGTFQISSTTGVITVLSNTALDFETNTSLPITVSVSGVSPSVSGLSVTVAITNVIEAPVNTVAPVISGTATIGSVLSVTSNGTWTDMGAGSFSYQWNNGADISGATSSSYTVQAGDSGDNIICKVTATNAASSTEADSNSIGPIGAAPSSASLDFSDANNSQFVPLI